MSLAVAYREVEAEGDSPESALRQLGTLLEVVAEDGWTVRGEIEVKEMGLTGMSGLPRTNTTWVANVETTKTVEVP